MVWFDMEACLYERQKPGFLVRYLRCLRFFMVHISKILINFQICLACLKKMLCAASRECPGKFCFSTLPNISLLEKAMIKGNVACFHALSPSQASLLGFPSLNRRNESAWFGPALILYLLSCCLGCSRLWCTSEVLDLLLARVQQWSTIASRVIK